MSYVKAIKLQLNRIDQLEAERDRWRGALVDCEKVMNVSANQLCTPVDSSGQAAINKHLVECVIRTRAALAGKRSL